MVMAWTGSFKEYNERYLHAVDSYDISGGKYSTVKKVIAEDGIFVLKSNDRSFPIRGEIEFLLQSPVSPKLTAYSIECNWLLMEYIDGQTYDRNDSKVDPQLYKDFGDATKRVHQVHGDDYKSYLKSAEGQTYRSYRQLFADIYENHYSSDAFVEFLSLDIDIREVIPGMITKIKPGQPVLTHGDLHTQNAIFTKNGSVYLIDPAPERFMDRRWDYSMLKWQLLNNKNIDRYLEAFQDGYGMKFEDSSIDQSLSDLMVALSLEKGNFERGGEEPWKRGYLNDVVNNLRDLYI